MATATLECEVCYKEYNFGNRKPLCLQCGHSFCFSCVSSLPDCFGTINCPKCKKGTLQPIDKMLVVHSLIPSENKARQRTTSLQSQAPCPHEGKALDYLCVDCMELVCFTCTRNRHATHKIKLIDALLHEDDIVDLQEKIRITMEGKLETLNFFVSVSAEIFCLMNEILNLKTDLYSWKDSLLAQKASTEQDLKGLSLETIKTMDENERQKCKDLLSRLKLKRQENSKIQEINARLYAVSKKCTSLVLPNCELMPDAEPWTVTSYDEGERAVASLFNNIKPSRLVVLSTHTRPIPGLGELLYRLSYHHTGDISLLPLDSFWKPAGWSDEEMGAVISESGRWLDAVYGSPDQVLTYLKIRRREPRDFSVRLASNEDLERCMDLASPIANVCCVQGAPSDVGTTMQGRGYTVTRWHFPGLRNGCPNGKEAQE
ncbi:E3 ubiquitin-protein ligase TRIM7 [Hyalella azteca]|uniref:E3 ubiquitin-protein ligase TRIM7 n=1 Tax=Hyalella azteca TaxID=294128 RepID=A0A8B7N911_HYAAZ|nr:E3 ubiquitin-protein ligase TRIM7 [Hyalella azteca]